MEEKTIFSKPIICYTVTAIAIALAVYFYFDKPTTDFNNVKEGAPARSYQEFDGLRLNFERTYPVIPPPPPGNFIPFAYSYLLDLATIRTMLEAGAFSVKISNGLDAGGKRVIIFTPVDDNYLEMAGGNYFSTDEKLCPVLCDRTLGAAPRTIPTPEASQCRDNYENIPIDQRDFYTSFVITKTALGGLMREPANKNIRAYHLLNGTARMVGLIGVSNDGFNNTALVYLQDFSSLCPPLCD